MRVISKRRLIDFWSQRRSYANAEGPLVQWYVKTRAAVWRNTADVKLTFGVNVDFVLCDSGRRRCIFDAGGNHYRIVCDVHYLKQHPEKGRVYVLRVMDHAEYDKELWKRDF